MAPTQRYQKSDILHAATELIRRDGPSALNARSLARTLGCSTQPIFRLFTGMDELRSAVVQKVFDTFYTSMYARMDNAANPYLQMGLHYLSFAKHEPQLFKLLFMRDRVTDGCYAKEEAAYADLFDRIARSMSISHDEAAGLYNRTWVHTHGLAVAIATKYIPCMDEADMEAILLESCQAAAAVMHLKLATTKH